MNANLARVLVQKGIIRQGTIIEAYQSARGLSCQCDSHKLTEFVVVKATASNGYVYFDAVSGREEQKSRIRCDYVATIDGMEIKRVAASHHITEDGEPIKVSTRRGRRRDKRLLLPKYTHDQESQSLTDHVGADQRLG